MQKIVLLKQISSYVLGLRFGITQSKVGLAVLLQNYRFYLNSRTKTPLTMAPRSLVLAAEGGIWLDVQRIQSQSNNELK